MTLFESHTNMTLFESHTNMTLFEGHSKMTLFESHLKKIHHFKVMQTWHYSKVMYKNDTILKHDTVHECRQWLNSKRLPAWLENISIQSGSTWLQEASLPPV